MEYCWLGIFLNNYEREREKYKSEFVAPTKCQGNSGTNSPSSNWTHTYTKSELIANLFRLFSGRIT